MTITYIGAGTAATAVNASVTPVAHASTAAGDMVLVFASIRNSGVGVVDVPTGWSRIVGTANFSVLGRVWQAGDVIPAITFTGGVANADTIAQTITFRGVEARLNDAVGASAVQLNGSAANVDYPALAVPGANHAVIIAMWKQDDNTGVSTPGGFTAVASTTVTTGDDASQAVRYQIQTTDTDISAATLTVTGGAAAISRSVVLALRPAAAFAVQEQSDVYPPRVLATVTGLTVGHDQVTIVRTVAGVDTTLRGGESADPVLDSSFVVADAELPFGVPVRYAAIVNGAVRYEAGPTTYTLPGGNVAVTDAITGLAVEAVILSWPDKIYDRKASVYAVGARNIVVSGDLGQFEGDVTFYLQTDVANAAFLELMRTATEATVQIRQPGGYADVDCYAVVTTVKATRFSQDGSDPRRTWVCHLVETDGWAPTLEAQGFTLQDIYDFYGASGTLQDLSDDYATLLAVAQADWS